MRLRLSPVAKKVFHMEHPVTIGRDPADQSDTPADPGSEQDRLAGAGRRRVLCG
jgi:hypothetical protein